MKGYCLVCEKEIEVQMCCSGRDCGCMGQPTEPPVCSSECYDIWEDKRKKEHLILEPYRNEEGLLIRKVGEKEVIQIEESTPELKEKNRLINLWRLRDRWS